MPVGRKNPPWRLYDDRRNTREMYERAYRWMERWDLVGAAKLAAEYHEAVLA